jgi:hypothetical protein
VKRLEHTDERGITERQSRRAEEARQAEEMLTTEDAEAERWRRERNEEVVNEKMLKGKLKKQKMEVHLGERTEVSNGELEEARVDDEVRGLHAGTRRTHSVLTLCSPPPTHTHTQTKTLPKNQSYPPSSP